MHLFGIRYAYTESMTTTHNIHEITIRTSPEGEKMGYAYRGVRIIGLDKRSTRFEMKNSWIHNTTRTERSTRTTIARTVAQIDHLLDNGIRIVNAEGVMISAKDVK
jgi:hypothetical protein